jgi:hypothetical protein
LDGAMRLVERLIRKRRGTSIRIGNRDRTKPLSADHVRPLLRWQIGIGQ